MKTILPQVKKGTISEHLTEHLHMYEYFISKGITKNEITPLIVSFTLDTDSLKQAFQNYKQNFYT